MYDAGYIHRYSQLLKKLLSSKGEPVEGLAPELLAAIVLETDRPEWHALGSQVDWTTGNISIAANVGKIGQVEVLNPGGSGLIVVVTKAKVRNVPAGPVRYILALNPAAGGAPVANVALDTRVKAVSSQNRILNTQAGANGTQLDEKDGTVTGSDVEFDFLPVVLTPGNRLALECLTVNTLVEAVMMGYERPLEVEETG